MSLQAYISALKGNLNLTSVPLGQRVIIPYIKQFLNGTNILNRSTLQQMYIEEVINGNTTLVNYIPTNVTEYSDNRTIVIDLTNVASGCSHYINIPKTTALINSISFSATSNFTASAIAIKSYTANATNITGESLPKVPGNVASYLFENSTIND